MNKLLAVAVIGLSFFFGIHEPSYAATITVINVDGPGEGFNDPSGPDPASTVGGNPGATLGQQRLIAFQFAANLWGDVLESNIEIRVVAVFDPLPCNATSARLGQAGPITFHRDFVGAPIANTWYVPALANARHGADLSPTTDDIRAQFNSSFGTTCAFPAGWYYGLDGNSGLNFDFVTVVLHELGHGLGFISFIELSNGRKLLGFDDAYSRLLENHATGKLFPIMTDAERFEASRAGANLHWTGTEANTCGSALTAGRDPVTGHIEMYAPNPAQGGSSVSHFSTTLSPNQLMEPFINEPLLNLAILVDPCLLADLGWSLPLPPPPPPPPPPPVFCNGLRATIVGTNASETIIGTPIRDIIVALGGNDVVRGNGGNDVICGNGGNDRLFGNGGRDRLFGQGGRDALSGGSARDLCNGGSGRDTASSNCEVKVSIP